MTAIDERPVVHGPYASLDAAAADAEHVYASVRELGDRGLLPRILEGLELATLRECGVELGAGDLWFAAYLSSWEPEFVQIVDGWVERAFQAGQASAAPAVDRGLRMVRCAGSGDCVTTQLLPAGASFLCRECGNHYDHTLRGN